MPIYPGPVFEDAGRQPQPRTSTKTRSDVPPTSEESSYLGDLASTSAETHAERMARLRQLKEESALELEIARDRAALKRISSERDADDAKKRKLLYRPGELIVTIPEGDGEVQIESVPLPENPFAVPKVEIKEEVSVHNVFALRKINIFHV